MISVLAAVLSASMVSAQIAATVEEPALSDAFVEEARKAYASDEFSGYTNTLLTTARFCHSPGSADRTPGRTVRWIKVDGTTNFRDIGGWNGLRTGRVFRGAEPNCQPRSALKDPKTYHNLLLTPAGEKTLSETLGIRTDLDLRGRGESPTPDETPVPGAHLVRIPCGSYTNFLRNTVNAAKLLRVFADAKNYPIYFHCYGGADRTGSLAFLLEGLCGVSEADLCIDYELTSFSRIGRRPRTDKPYYYYASMVREMKRRPGKTLAEKIASYVRDECGLSDAEIAAIRRQLTVAVKPVAAEAPYAFRERLEVVHAPDCRDRALRPAPDEFAFADGVVVGDADFADYLNVSMNVRATVGEKGPIAATIDPALRDREYVVEVRRDGVTIRAADDRALHQAYYHLEDLMNLRRAPFLKIGTERRRMRFSPRMIHSGYACDIFPDNYLRQIAHHGFDAIVFYIKDVDKTAAGRNQDVNGMIERARRVGLDTYLYSSVSCFAHPDDPKGKSEIENSFGRVAKAHPGAKGIVFVGESCQFPSKDPRVQPVRHQHINHNDPRPLAGWFPCRDYPDWLKAVEDVLHRYSPKMEIVFWTYNWSRQDAKVCAELIPNFPDGVAIQGTLGNGAVTTHDNGLVCHCRDYTVSTAGFTDHYAAQAKAAKASNRRFYTMANTAGLTWDYGTAPYLPCPHQWKKRWDGLVDPQYGIAGLMETHHFGWYPSFISELAKEAYTEGGMAFDEHIRKIAARDFGEANADKVVEAWKRWSRTEVDYVANNENQYGPFRIGPAFPFNFGGKKILHAEFPQDKKAYHTMRWMAILNFPFDLEQAHEQNIAYVALDDEYRRKQLELFERMRADFAAGVGALREAAGTLTGARRAKAEEMIGVGEWHQHTVETAINLNRGYLAFKRGDRAEMLKFARAEYANARAALALAERDSRLGWEPSMEYAAGPEQIRWKLNRMEELYGTEAVRGSLAHE